VLYHVSYYMNMSPINIHYQERQRIYNFLLFQLLFVFLE
jgi:fructosamine-3-kinase